jgi:hypothetical protein
MQTDRDASSESRWLHGDRCGHVLVEDEDPTVRFQDGTRVRAKSGTTVAENISLIVKQILPEFDAGSTCAGHTDGGCSH